MVRLGTPRAKVQLRQLRYEHIGESICRSAGRARRYATVLPGEARFPLRMP
jgi:hypothetical protein